MSAMPHSPAELGGNPALISGPEAGIALRHLMLRPTDADGPARARRLKELGVGEQPVPELDALARELAVRLGGRIGAVNLIGDTHQYFAGFYAEPPAEPASEEAPEQAPQDQEETAEEVADETAEEGDGRALGNEVGFCPHVIARRRSLVLDDVRDFARFSVDPVIDMLGVHSYIGVPLMDSSGIALGTVCVADQDPQRWGREDLAVVKEAAAQVMERLRRGEFRG